MKTTKRIDEGFNKIKPWLSRKLKDRQMSVDRFSVATRSRVLPTAIRRWYRDECRPQAETMKIVCETLSRLPVIKADGSKHVEDVPWTEGLATYKPRPRGWEAHYASRPTPSPSRSLTQQGKSNRN